MMEQCLPEVPAGRNPGLTLGAVIGEAALGGRDKLTLLADPELSSFGSWVEQLIAESSGKHGKGIIPIDIEPELRPDQYGPDRLFVYMCQSGSLASFAASLRQAGQPVIELDVPTEYDLVAEFYRWEYATAVACSTIGVNAFDQPDVQDSKNRTAAKVAAYQKNGKLDENKPAWTGEDGLAFGELPFDASPLKTTGRLIGAFLNVVKPGDYVAINAYLPRNPEMLEKLQALRQEIQKITGTATTLGFGPRFQHSTGQLHKGGPDSGVFIQLTEDAGVDLAIPEEGLTFAVFERAQALGDFEALQARGRRALRIQLKAGAFPRL
jgi:transaldolase/glucose-6-phosphate isomerase